MLTEVGLALSVLLPTLCFLQTRRSHAFFASFGYYAAASSIIIPGAKTFFGPDTGFGVIIWLWIPASILLALPYAVFWSDRRASAFWRAPLAVLASVPPPLGIIGWANPLTAAGILFPGTAWLGLILILAFAGSIPSSSTHFVCSGTDLGGNHERSVSGNPTAASRMGSDQHDIWRDWSGVLQPGHRVQCSTGHPAAITGITGEGDCFS